MDGDQGGELGVEGCVWVGDLVFCPAEDGGEAVVGGAVVGEEGDEGIGG